MTQKHWHSVYSVLACVVLICIGLLVALKINLITADLGRHIENGKILMSGNSQEVQDILHTNFYSFTNQSFPFINHHWGIGVLFYEIWKYTGFNGLSLVYILLSVATIGLSFWFSIKKGTFASSLASLVLVIALITSRREVRPEMLSYFFTLIFFCMMWAYKENIIKRKWLWLLVVLEVLWVNIHIAFFLGEVIIGLYLLHEIVCRKPNWKEIRFRGLLLGGVVLATFINPSFIAGALYPLFIFKNYGYQLYENQSVFFLENLGFHSFEFVMLKISLFVTWFLAALYIWKEKHWGFIVEPLTIMVLFSSILALSAERSIIIFALFALPFISFLLTELFVDYLIEIFSPHVLRGISVGLTITLVVITFLSVTTSPQWGIGLLPKVEASAQFFKTNNLTGPIYNDYDIGSYLDYELDITTLSNKNKVFVDNRPEAYPATFFKDVYIPSQSDEQKWQSLNAEYHFNVIWFNRHDLTSWAQQFLAHRTQDAEWALVYLGDYSVILFKRSTE